MQLFFFGGYVCFLKTYVTKWTSLQTSRLTTFGPFSNLEDDFLGDGLKAAGMKDNDLHLGLLGDGNSNIFVFFIPIPWGRWTQFDEHIFQMGWN